jgi:multidrug efflux pump subunit AcrA (membrane-fusion protein)
MKMLSRNSLIIAVVVGLMAGIGWKLFPKLTEAAGGGGKGGKHRMGAVKRGDLVQRVTVSGEVVPARRTIFVAPYSGYVQRLFVTVGQKVNKGDPVLSITSSLQSPETVYPIRAPFAGTVVSISKKEGEYVTEKDTKDVIVRVDDLETYYVLSKAPETDAARIKKNMEVEIKINAIQKETLKGIVRNIELAAEEADGWKAQQSTFKVQVEVLKPPLDLRSGQSAVIDIVTKKWDNVLYLEHEFINKDGDQAFVIDGKGRRRDITIGNQSDLAAEIVDGLKEGDKVEQVDFLKLLESGGK